MGAVHSQIPHIATQHLACQLDLQSWLTAILACADQRLKSKTLTPNLNVRWQADDWRKEHPTYTQTAAPAAELKTPTALSMPSSSSRQLSAQTTAAGSSGLVTPAGYTITQVPQVSDLQSGLAPAAGAAAAAAAAEPEAFTLSPAAAALLEAAHAQGLDTATAPAAFQTAAGASSSSSSSSSTGHRAGYHSYAAAGGGLSSTNQVLRGEVRLQIPPAAAAAAAARGQPSASPNRPASTGRTAAAVSYSRVPPAEHAAPGQRHSAESGWGTAGPTKSQVPRHVLSSSSGKAVVQEDRSRLRKAFDGVFVTSKHNTAVNMRMVGLLVDLIFRVRGTGTAYVAHIVSTCASTFSPLHLHGMQG